jgi:transcriptional regulator with XRE-family HTH domain
LNSPSMWFFTMNITLVPVLVIGVLYLLLAAEKIMVSRQTISNWETGVSHS